MYFYFLFLDIILQFQNMNFKDSVKWLSILTSTSLSHLYHWWQYHILNFLIIPYIVIIPWWEKRFCKIIWSSLHMCYNRTDTDILQQNFWSSKILWHWNEWKLYILKPVVLHIFLHSLKLDSFPSSPCDSSSYLLSSSPFKLQEEILLNQNAFFLIRTY